MNSIDSIIEECVYNTPLVLLSLIKKDSSLIDKINSYLPFSTGFEIECNMLESYDHDAFKKIPNILDVQVDTDEQRYRIPRGINGMICLYNICNQLKTHSSLNPLSGIHYHVDMSDCFKSLIPSTFVEESMKEPNFLNANQWILDELDKWNYKGTYNRRSLKIDTRNGWINFQSGFMTCEIRIGEMSFDYKLLIKRIIDANRIVSMLREKYTMPIPENNDPIVTIDELVNYNSTYSTESNGHKLEYEKLKVLQEKLELEGEETHEEEPVDNIQKTIKRRIIKVD